MSGLEKWIHCSRAQAWVPEHTVGSLLSHTVTPAPGSHGFCSLGTAGLGKTGWGNSGVACRGPGAMRDFSGCSRGEASLLIQKKSPGDERATRKELEPTQILHPHHRAHLAGPDPSGSRPTGNGWEDKKRTSLG